MFFSFFSLLRPTGWHGESGSAVRGGHLIVQFYRQIGRRWITQHVYRCNEAYCKSSFFKKSFFIYLFYIVASFFLAQCSCLKNVVVFLLAPKRARKTGITAPLSSIALSKINKNLESAPSGSSFVGLSDIDNKKLSRFFDFLRDDLQWSYGKLLYCTTIGKAPGTIKDKTGKSTNTKVVQRNAAVIQHFMNGTGKYGPSQILEN